jgi:predicted porin
LQRLQRGPVHQERPTKIQQLALALASGATVLAAHAPLSAGRQYSPFHWAMVVGDAMDAVYRGNAYGAVGFYIYNSVGVHRVVAAVTQMRYDLGSLPQGRSLVAGIACDHALSKRTRLYASYGQVDNNATARTPLFASVVAVTPNGFGSDPRALSLGIRHTF